jgi:hypothetical protein
MLLKVEHGFGERSGRSEDPCNDFLDLKTNNLDTGGIRSHGQ